VVLDPLSDFAPAVYPVGFVTLSGEPFDEDLSQVYFVINDQYLYDGLRAAARNFTTKRGLVDVGSVPRPRAEIEIGRARWLRPSTGPRPRALWVHLQGQSS
jgi:hypothetical protein